MSLAFRNLDITPDDPVEAWGVEGVLAAIDRGEVEHWAAIARSLSRDTTGELAATVREALASAESVGVGVLLRRALERAEDPDAWDTTEAMRRAARRSGLDQGELAARAATSRTRMNSYLTGAQLPSARTARRIQRIAARIGTAG